MQILVLTDQIYPDAIGGVGKSVYNECVALAQRGHHITIFVRSLNATLPKQTSVDGLKIVRFLGPQYGTLFYYFYPLAIIYFTWRWLNTQSQHYDVICIHNPFFLVGARLSHYFQQVPLIYFFVAAISAEIAISAKHQKYGKLNKVFAFVSNLLRNFEKHVLTWADYVVPRSLFTLAELQNISPKAKTFQPNYYVSIGLDLSKYINHPKNQARERLHLPSDSLILITVRRLEGRMGLGNLIQAMDIIRQQNPNVLLLMAGKGTLRPALEQQIIELRLEDKVRLLGLVAETDLPIYLSASDLFVLPTEELEGFGLATIEALATGLPVVGTPVGATPEILQPIDPRLLTVSVTPDAIADTILYWMSHREQLNDMASTCRAMVEKRFDADKIAEQLEGCFSNANANPNRN